MGLHLGHDGCQRARARCSGPSVPAWEAGAAAGTWNWAWASGPGPGVNAVGPRCGAVRFGPRCCPQSWNSSEEGVVGSRRHGGACRECGMWGKSKGLTRHYPLRGHLIDTAAMAGELWDSYLSEGQRQMIAEGFGVDVVEAAAMVRFWAGLHDIGKACPCFQDQPGGPAPVFLATPDFVPPMGWMHQDPVAHERVTHLVAPHLLARYGYDNTSRPSKSSAHQIAQILGGHHGVYGRALDREHLTDPSGGDARVGTAPGWMSERQEIADLLYDLTGKPVAPRRIAKPAVAVVVTGLIVTADWLASRLGWVKARQAQWERDDPHDWQAHYERAVAYAPRELARTQLQAPRWKPAAAFRDVFPEIKDPHPLQADLDRLPDVIQACGSPDDKQDRRSGLVLITAPTGDGKTESALYAALVLASLSGRPGLAVLLPTMATTNAMWERVTEYVGRQASNAITVTLQHSMAWLNLKYAPGEGPADDTVLTAGCGCVRPNDWLRGRHRGWLSGATVATWDQGAIAALPIRFGCMRWLGISGKTIIIDEAHAYDAYGHALTVRLLEWLGQLRAPVVLLSATLAGGIARRLVNAYRAGAGHHEPSTIEPAYPGWLFADARTGDVIPSEALRTTRARDLPITTITARHTHDPEKPDGRARALLDHLAPLYDATADTGSVLVVCNTVGDAQATYKLLTTHKDGTRRPRVLLLHARMSERRRDKSTDRLKTLLGKTGPRPTRPVIVVSTQVAEQSLDIDADLVISDLAPLAQLLQRAGRCHRHDITGRGTRPAWAPLPSLTVLVPTGQLPPQAWGHGDKQVYQAALLRRTAEHLAQLPTRRIHVPKDVAAAINTVYADYNALAEQTLAQYDDRQLAARDAAQQAAADIRTIPSPCAVTDLYPLTTYDGDEDDLTTRLGAATVRLLPVYLDQKGSHWLNRQRTRPLPEPADGQQLDRATVEDLVRRSIQAPAHYLPFEDSNTHTPDAWADTPIACDLRLLPHHRTGTPAKWKYQAPSGHTLHAHRAHGIVRERGTD
ncbi:CRISPR-associated helicase Cas3' [Kitasatospora sp. NPDC088783]|uniref:CRISPR-associated helicase Cas3' n=1 Tax=Kitasatospora sp. NPDC088783 TaxID=3364077 RepID=UPI0037FCB081